MAVSADGCPCACRYIFLIGMLMSQFTITGYDACAHMSEETKGGHAASILGLMSLSAFALVSMQPRHCLIFAPCVLAAGADK